MKLKIWNPYGLGISHMKFERNRSRKFFWHIPWPRVKISGETCDEEAVFGVYGKPKIIIFLVWFLWHRRCNRQDVSWYIPLQESQIATLRDHRTSIWLAFFMCSVFTSQSISNSYIKLVILYSPVQFLTPSHNFSVAAERLGERNTWLYSSAVNICFWLHLYIFTYNFLL